MNTSQVSNPEDIQSNREDYRIEKFHTNILKRESQYGKFGDVTA
jgi:hypothetical protein